MYFPAKQPASVDALVEHYHRSLDALNKCMVWQGNALTLLPGTDISNTLAPGQLARVESGLVYVNWGARTAFILQPGDFIFHFNTLKEKSLAYLAEETVKIKCINAEHLSTQLTSHTEYLQHWQARTLSHVDVQLQAASTTRYVGSTGGSDLWVVLSFSLPRKGDDFRYAHGGLVAGCTCIRWR